MIDRLIDKIGETGAPIAVGLDPTPEMIPERIKSACREAHSEPLKAVAASLLAFNREIIDAVYDLVPVVKPQIAMYERFGPEGLRAYFETAAYAKRRGLLVIGDIKRGDIASTAAAYTAHLSGAEVDAVTLNPYLGYDSVKPFIDVCTERDKGVFILVKTSNPGSADLQDLPLASGETVFEHVAARVSEWGESLVGARGYSKVCAVVGATFPEQGRALRGRMPRTFFLLPGYGAQGGTAENLRGCFDRDGGGCVVNSSRGIIAAWQKDGRFGETNVGDAARLAVLAMREDLKEALS